MIKRSHIRQLLAVVDAGSFTQAAARLRVTQPTLSIGIAELERLVGSRLLIRDRRRLRLTEAGGKFLPIARNLERGFHEADKFGLSGAAEWPNLRLGVIRTLPPAGLQAAIGSLSQTYAIELIEGSDSELRSFLSEGRLDLMIGLLRADDGEDRSIELIEEAYTMLVPLNHRLAGVESVQPEDLSSEVMIARRSCELLNETSRFFTMHHVRPRFSFRSDNDERCLQMVAAGLGITNAPQSLAIAGTAQLRVDGYNFRRRVGIRFANLPQNIEIERVSNAALDYKSALAAEFPQASLLNGPPP